MSARGSWLDSNLIPDLDGLDCRSDLCDDTAGFVAETHRRLEDEWPNGAVLPVVHVRAADAGELDADENIAAGLQLWDWTVLEGDGEGFVEDEGLVLLGIRTAVGRGGRDLRFALVETPF